MNLLPLFSAKIDVYKEKGALNFYTVDPDPVKRTAFLDELGLNSSYIDSAIVLTGYPPVTGFAVLQLQKNGHRVERDFDGRGVLILESNKDRGVFDIDA